jgi:hypothetical protein
MPWTSERTSARVLDPFITGQSMIDGALQTFATLIERTVAQLEVRP